MSGRVIWSDGETELVDAGGGRVRLTVGNWFTERVTPSALRAMVAALDAGEAGEATKDGALKPCPFCAGVAEVYRSDAGDSGWDTVAACAGDCGATITTQGSAEPSRAAAIAAWNRRAPQPSLAGKPGEGEKCETCRGVGRVNQGCSFGHDDVPCPGMGPRDCPRCGGTGRAPQPSPAAALVEAAKRVSAYLNMLSLSEHLGSADMFTMREHAIALRAALSAHDAAGEGRR